jgi:hypothetical protein
MDDNSIKIQGESLERDLYSKAVISTNKAAFVQAQKQKELLKSMNTELMDLKEKYQTLSNLVIGLINK